MSLKFVSLEDAKAASGIRMTTVSGVPSPWSESAKGIFYVKGIEWLAIRHVPMDEEMHNWTGAHNAPALMHNDDTARTSWAEILMLAERLRPEPTLLPADAFARAWMFGLAHELMGEGGLAWSRRIQLINLGMQMEGPSRKRAAYLASKYGYSEAAAKNSAKRTTELLSLLTNQLRAQRSDGSDYLVGNGLTAVDIYSAAVMALFEPLSPDKCDMDPASRMAFSYLDDATRNALDPILLEHRDQIYERHLETPLSL